MLIASLRRISLLKIRLALMTGVAQHQHCYRCCEGCPVLPSNVPGYPGMSYDIYTEMSDLKKKKKRRERHHSLTLALTLTLTVILGPNHPATSHCYRIAVHCTVFNTPTLQHYSRASQDYPGIIPGQLKATLDNTGRMLQLLHKTILVNRIFVVKTDKASVRRFHW